MPARHRATFATRPEPTVAKPAKAAPVGARRDRAPRSRPKQPGDIRYRDRRLMAIYFDMSAMPVPDQMRAVNAAHEVHQDADGRPRT